MPNVFSKLANSQKYTGYAPPLEGTDGRVNTVESHVHIRGGANLADKFLQTPLGVMTPVTDDEAKFLEEHNIFKLHKKNGFVSIEYKAKASDVDAVVADMGDTVDGSAPVTDSEFAENDGVIGKGFNGKPTAETSGGKSGSGKAR